MEVLCRNYKVQTGANIDPSALIDKYNKEVELIYARYALLKKISKYGVEGKDVGEYINLIDSSKGV